MRNTCYLVIPLGFHEFSESFTVKITKLGLSDKCKNIMPLQTYFFRSNPPHSYVHDSSPLYNVTQRFGRELGWSVDDGLGGCRI